MLGQQTKLLIPITIGERLEQKPCIKQEAAHTYISFMEYSLLNLETNKEEIPHAVLIRGGYPIIGLDIIKNRTTSNKCNHLSMNGPGKLSKLMGIHQSIDGIRLKHVDCTIDGIWIEDLGYSISLKEYRNRT